MNDVPTAIIGLAESYATNALSIKLAATRFIILPTTDEGTDIDRIPRAALGRVPMHIVSAWNPQGEPTTFERNQLHAAKLQDAVAKRTHDLLSATLIGAGSAWYEQAIAVNGSTDKQAVALGKRSKQAAVIRIDRDGWHVLPTDLHEEVEHPFSLGWRLQERTGRTCAMKALDLEPQPCKMNGGPFGSAAMAAAATWIHQRRVAVTLLGCDNCETRSTDIAEQGLILNPSKVWCVVSRHSAAVTQDRAKRKYYIQAGVIGEDFPGWELA